ncbi:hypothetical protein B0T10DRAFT_577314 [Thelonectria olida]|uniref:Uncharacterized protein n=1 Tax=Thelonectria olida TaxID=1576542 RepID=A0A9P8VY75_9HYPO|nr:hypothetical protein B0T10DRAFT_577314 [Thelonectria olida]
MADSIRGDGLFRADMALAALVVDPQRLDRARERFSEPPPSYTSHLSHNSTLSQSPNPPSEEQRRREERKWQLIREHGASLPSNRFATEKSEEIDRLYEGDRYPTRRQPVGTNHCKLAWENVKKRWVEQGIWNDKWKSRGGVWRWKHEEPLEPESEWEIDSEAGAATPLFGLPSERTKAKPSRRKSTEELRRIAERRPIREREREASRPFYQFVYQVSKERERIQDDMNLPEPSAPDWSDLNMTIYGEVQYQAALQAWAGNGQSQDGLNVQRATIPPPLGINTTAYERVKNNWMETGIWNSKWGVLPGMSWKHEQPLQEMLREEVGDDPTPPPTAAIEGDRHGTEEAPPRSIFESILAVEPNHEASGMLDASQQEAPAASISDGLDGDSNSPGRAHLRWCLFGSPSSAEANHSQVSDGLNVSPQEPPCPAIDPAGLRTGDANPSSATSTSQRSHAESGRAQQIPRTALGLVHPSKVSKARGKSGRDPRRRSSASKLPSAARQSLPGPADPLKVALIPPRRSRRLQEVARKTGADSPGIATLADWF